MKIFKELKGLPISISNRVPLINEQYGILDRNAKFKEQLLQLSVYLHRNTLLYEKFKDDICISNLTTWLEELTIQIDFNFNFAAVFNFYEDFRFEASKVLHATIQINPKNISCVEDIYAGLYHEIKHIFDYMISKVDGPLKENLFRDYFLIDDNVLLFQTFKPYLIDCLKEDLIISFIAKTLFYLEKSECSAYLENIDQDYKTTLNDKNLIVYFLLKGKSIQEIKLRLYYNNETTKYILIYSNLEMYLKYLIETKNLETINKLYKDIFKEVYNVNTLEKVIEIYIKRIKKVKEQSMKLFNDRYENSFLWSLMT